MPIVMYDKRSGSNVKVYGFVAFPDAFGANEEDLYAVTYQVPTTKKLSKIAKQSSPTAEDLFVKLIHANDLRPLDI